MSFFHKCEQPTQTGTDFRVRRSISADFYDFLRNICQKQRAIPGRINRRIKPPLKRLSSLYWRWKILQNTFPQCRRRRLFLWKKSYLRFQLVRFNDMFRRFQVCVISAKLESIIITFNINWKHFWIAFSWINFSLFRFIILIKSSVGSVLTST